MRIKLGYGIVLGVILISLLFVAVHFFAIINNLSVGQEYLKQAQAQRDALQLQVNALMEDLEYARTDDYVIRVARDEGGMVMPGEIRYMNGSR